MSSFRPASSGTRHFAAPAPQVARVHFGSRHRERRHDESGGVPQVFVGIAQKAVGDSDKPRVES